MKLQNLLMPQAGRCTQQDMYFRVNKKVHVTDCQKALTFRKHGVAWFDTYFNGLSIEKWKKYTSIGRVSVTLLLKGKFEIQLCSKEKIHQTISERVLSATAFDSEEVEAVTLPFLSYEEKGMYFVRLEGLEDGAQYFGGYYEADVPNTALWPVDIAINICTFRREAFVKRNLEILRKAILQNPEHEMYQHLQVFISDNGKTLDIPDLAGRQVHIVPNKNVGGAGGFTRGLIEILHCPDYAATHLLFMDDDILIEPEALFRTYTLLHCRKKEYEDLFIGGAMLRLDQQNIQVEAGAAWNAGSLQSRKSGVDLNTVDGCLYNEIEEYVEFNAWWYCCTPMSVVREDNLPLPIFIRGDDLEYGLRNMRHLLLMNGICVWHEPFENKYSSFLEYYILRNLLYDNALHCPGYSKWQFLRRLYSNVIRQLFYYRYQNVELIFRGINDFFKGVDFLRGTDGEKLHQEIMAAGYKAMPVEELDISFEYPVYEQSFAEHDRGLHKLVRMLTFNGLLLPAKRDAVVSMAQCRPVNFYRAKRVLHYDVTSRKAFVTEKKMGKSLGVLFNLACMTGKVLLRFDGTVAKFRNESQILMSEQSWREYLQLETKEACV